MSVGAKRRLMGSMLGGRKHRMGPAQKFATLGLTAVAAVCVLAVSGVAEAQTDLSTTVAPPVTVAPVEPTTTAPLFSDSTTTVAPTTAPVTTVAPTTSAPTTSAPTVTSTTVPVTTSTIPVPGISIPRGRTLKSGRSGPDVLALEQRLEELRFDTGKVDGKFDQSTWQGVVAFQKVNGLKRTGTVDDNLKGLIEQSALPSGLIVSGGPTRIEVDISRQVLFLYKDGSLYRVVSVSSGSGKKYCDVSGKTGEQVCGEATTPRGKFRIQRRIPGWRESDLGKLYNPLYFTGGFAFHGAPSVPAYPASHGCVRLPMSVAEWFPSAVANGTSVYVYD